VGVVTGEGVGEIRAHVFGVHIDYGTGLSALDFVLRACRSDEASAVLELWEQTRSEHATMPDRLDDVGRLLSHDAGSLLVADDDDIAVSFWEAAGYPQDHEIGRHVRNL
jgi:hypothetical protein